MFSHRGVGMVVAGVLTLGGAGFVHAADEAPGAEEVFKKKDTNGDGKLSLEEFKGKAQGDGAAKAEAAFKKLDKDSDGALSLEEFKAGHGKGKKAE